MDEDNQKIYMLMNFDEQRHTIYQLSYAKGKAGTMTAIDDEVYCMSSTVKAGKCYYMKECKILGDHVCVTDLYCDGELIGE